MSVVWPRFMWPDRIKCPWNPNQKFTETLQRTRKTFLIVNIILAKYSRKNSVKIGRIKCSWNLHKMSTKRTAENFNKVYTTKWLYIMSIKSANNVRKIYSENYLKCAQNVNIFSVKEQGKENRKKTNPNI